MKAVNIDFAPVRGAGHRPGARNWLIVAALLGALAVAGALFGNNLASQAAAMRIKAQEIDATRDAERSAALVKDQIAPDVADAINGVIRMLDYPVMDLLAQLERCARPNVSLMSVELGSVRSSLRIIIQAPGLPEALDYLEALRAEPGFRNVSIIRQEPDAGDRGDAWRFTLETPQGDPVQRATARTPGRGQE